MLLQLYYSLTYTPRQHRSHAQDRESPLNGGGVVVVVTEGTVAPAKAHIPG